MQRVSIVILYLLVIGLAVVVAQLWTSAPDATMTMLDEDLRVVRQELREVRNELKELGYKTLQQQAALDRLDAEIAVRAASAPGAVADTTITAVDTAATKPASAPVPAAEPAAATSPVEPSVDALVDDVMSAADENVAAAEAVSDTRKTVIFSDTTTGTYVRESVASSATLIADVIATAQQVFATGTTAPGGATEPMLTRMDLAELVSTAAAHTTVGSVLDALTTKTNEVAAVIKAARTALQSATAEEPPTTPAAPLRSAETAARTADSTADAALPGATPRTSTRAGTRSSGPGYIIDLRGVSATSVMVRTIEQISNIARRAAIEITPEDIAAAPTPVATEEPVPAVLTSSSATPTPVVASARSSAVPAPPTRVTSVPSVSAEPEVELPPVRPSRRARAEEARAAMDVTLNLSDRLVPGATGPGMRPVTMSDIMDAHERQSTQQPAATQE
jgi:hypothetical protein